MAAIFLLTIFCVAFALSRAIKRQQAKQEALASLVSKDREKQQKINERLAREQERQAEDQRKQQEKQNRINERIAREQERQAEEQERQAEQLAKHEAQIKKLEFRMKQADADIEHWNETLCELYAMLDYEKMEQAAAVVGGKEYAKRQNKIIALTNRVYSAEARLAKAQFAKEEAARQLGA